MTASTSTTYVANDGAAYERFIGRWTARLSEAVLDRVGDPPPGRLLDVGAGTGSMAFALRRRYPERSITATDVSPAYLAYARGRPEAEGVAFVEDDLCRSALPDGAFAAAYAVLVLNFVGDALAAAREMKRLCRSGGTAVAAGWDFRGGLTYQRLLWDTASVLDGKAAAIRDRLFASPLALPDGMTNLLREAGFAAVRRDEATIRMDFADFADFWEPLLGGQGPVGGYVAALAPEERSRIGEAVRRAFLTGAPDGPRSLTATAWVVTGTA
ncbi:class I SAM-dependent methyltransferase [Faunimonas sp. B44]|uniref:class I SAM-dependent methyltransferase n=1 Tax=Faunimonas sp. B44 TaxID=3461493 RepID=UPI004043D288